MEKKIFGKSRPAILVVDDELPVRESFKIILSDDYEVLFAETGIEALELIRKFKIDLVLLDIRLPGLDGIDVLRNIRNFDDTIDIIMVTAVNDVSTAVQAIKLGAIDYITKPFDPDEILILLNRMFDKQKLQKEVRYLRSELQRQLSFGEIIGKNQKMLEIYDLISNVSQTSATVLINGESGTGKELIARAIHLRSPRANMPFVPVNCAAIPDNLMESELFGHERGAFTGAIQKKIGKFEIANGGTIFLDEIGNLKIDLQAKLLRVLQEKEFERLGGIKCIPVDVRIIAASNVDLKKSVAEKNFREDLFYRLNVVPIYLPPLRERKDDIPLLVENFLEKYNKEFNKKIKGFSRSALSMMQNYNWPGNIRELENMVERLIALCKKDYITSEDLPMDIFVNGLGKDSEEVLTLRKARQEFDRQFVLRVMQNVNFNQTSAAKLLGIHRNTLMLMLNKLGIKGDLKPLT